VLVNDRGAPADRLVGALLFTTFHSVFLKLWTLICRR